MEFREEKVEVEPRVEQAVIVGGRKIGTVKETSDAAGRYLAGVHVPNGRTSSVSCLNLSLVLGYGETKEGAVKAALDRGYTEVSAFLAEIERLKREMRLENELDELLDC